ncbi:Sbal_3080 family lipoprotein [Stenoxybacter acetivorans]|uniref:Sbal_3080 family lipoprotein n=1 Tax=Stenoxybacter acetivorans TaxID=422441 RepID=UPI0005658994|nr:Sbal_3080 family lipoprotein [Stenoxybacter acetivorans]
MNSSSKAFLMILVVSGLSGCTSVDTQPLQSHKIAQIGKICILENPEVKVRDMVSVLQNRLRIHGIKSNLVNNTEALSCRYTLAYSARRSWDFTTYIDTVHLAIYDNNQLIAYTEYDGNNWSLTKWKSTAEVINPLVDSLLSQKR